jgi:hypothetical protein
LAAVVEDLRIPDTCHQRTRCDGPDSRDRLQALARRILTVPGVDFTLQFVNLSIECPEMFE